MSWLISVAALGVTVRIDGEALSADQRAAVAEAWRDARVADAPGDGVPPTVVAGASADTPGLLSDLSQRVTLAAIEARRGELWMLHAAGIASEDGAVVVLVGPSGRGKTTAARALAARGGYVSDETVAIDLDGRVHPYRKPLSIIEDADAPKAQRPSSSLGLRALPAADLRLGALVLLDRRPDGPEEPVIEPVDLGDALADLVEQTSYLAELPGPLQAIAAHVDRVGGVQRVRYRDAATLVALLPRLVAPAAGAADPAGRAADPAGRAADPAGRAAAEDGAAPTGRAAGDGGADVARPATPAYHRAPVHDALALSDPDRLALLTVDAAGAGTVRMLAGVAPAIWRAADGATIDDLVRAAVAAYGAPDSDPAALVQSAAAELTDAGILELRPPRWRIRDDVAWVDSGDRVVVLALADPHSPEPRALEGSAALIWLALAEGPAPAQDVTARVADAAGVAAELVAADVAAFLAELGEHDLAERV